MADATLFYDSDCGFCRWSLAKILAWDRRGAVKPIALDSPEADHALPGIPAERMMASWHLLDPQGRLHSGGAAFAPLFRLLPGGSPLAALVARTPRATERAYRWVAGNRQLWGRLITEGAKRRADRRIAGRSSLGRTPTRSDRRARR
jgi:predicted DCC family thiol-disulfide oxidoreductase YuxK